jgi:hypothetical protein
MRGLSLKLHSARGASMLMALFFLLVCLTAGAIMLAASTASAAKELNRYQEHQAYLAVSSAAQLLKKQLGGSSYVVTAVPYDTGKKDDEGNAVWAYKTVTTLSPADNLLTKNITAAGGVSLSETGSYTIDVDASDKQEALKVNAVYSMDASTKKATFVLTDAKTSRYKMTVTFNATTVTPNSLGEFSIFWDNGTVTKGAN